MTVRAFLAGAALVGAGVTLSGCGGGATTAAPTPAPAEAPTPAPAEAPTPAPAEAPTPAPIPAGAVQAAWDNHLQAFLAGAETGGVEGAALTKALDDIVKDYDEESHIAVFNDECIGDSKNAENEVMINGYDVHEGVTAIRAFFKGLFTELKAKENVIGVGPNGGPVVKEGKNPEGNVFLTWRTQNMESVSEIKYATDSFSWRVKEEAAKVWKQNIVTTQVNKPCVARKHTPAACTNTDAVGVCAGWTNHLKYFQEGLAAIDETLMKAALDGIMTDYTEESLVQVFDNKGDGSYTPFQGIGPIRGMFKKLFEDILAAATDGKPATNGFKVKVLEVEEEFNGVFLVWESLSHPKATDTFVFNDAGKIIRQNIVVETKSAAALVMV